MRRKASIGGVPPAQARGVRLNWWLPGSRTGMSTPDLVDGW